MTSIRERVRDRQPIRRRVRSEPKLEFMSKVPADLVREVRERFPDLDIPNPGPEPVGIEGELEPPEIEGKGVFWAIQTARGFANAAVSEPMERVRLFRKFLKITLANREKWERNTTAGKATFISKLLK